MIGISVNYSYSQDVGLATFHETAQVIIDKQGTQKAVAAITLQSNSIQEITIPAELDKKLLENNNVVAIILTNQDNCVLGVQGESCLLINVQRDPADKHVDAIRNSTLNISEQYINLLKEFLDVDAKFHSTFIHSAESAAKLIDVSKDVSAQVSAVYTLPMEATDSMYEKISALTIHKQIRDGDGFYNAAKNLSKKENATMMFSIVPTNDKLLMQLRVYVNYLNISDDDQINPLKFLDTDKLQRSKYFSNGFYPLNSIIQVIVLADKDTSITHTNTKQIPVTGVDGSKVPTAVTDGWIFDPSIGKVIQGKYIYGELQSVNADTLKFSLKGDKIKIPTVIKFDESIIILIIIIAVAIAAALFYLKGYKK